MKCSLSPSQQVNKKTGKKSKTCSIQSAWAEMNNERLGRDETIDKELTSNNVWMHGSTSDDVVKIVQDEIERINIERKDNGLRSLRADAVSVIEIIEKPPIDIMQNLTYEQKVRFLSDSHNVMTQLLNNWNSNWRVLESVQHHDEFGGLSPHNHTLVMLTSLDRNGVSTMRAKDEFNLKFFSYINKNYPQQMRNLGYDVEDCLTYDKLTDEEKLERKLHPVKRGVDAYLYKKQKAQEQNELLSHMKQESEELSDKLSVQRKELSQNIQNIKLVDTALSQKRAELSNVESELSVKKVAVSEINERIESSKQIELSNKKKEAALATAIAKVDELKIDYASKIESANSKEALYSKQLRKLTGVSDIRTYNTVVEENQLLKTELEKKEKIIESLRQNYDKVLRSLNEWKQKFNDISHKAGKKLMSFFGYDISDDNSVGLYPSKNISSSITSMFKEVETSKSYDYKVIPDSSPGTFRIAYKDESSGEYKTIKGGFSSRADAEISRKNLSDATQTFNNEISLENNMKLKRKE